MFLTKRVHFVVALSLYFSTLEALLPHPLFIRYGFAYIPLLVLSSVLTMREFITALIFKIIISAVFSLTLFSPLFLLTFFSSIASGIIIWIFRRVKIISHLGVSILSSFVSNTVQLYLSSLLLYGHFTLFLTPIVALSGIASSIAVGIISNIADNKINELFKNIDVINEINEKAFDYKFKAKTVIMLLLSLCVMISMIFLSSMFTPRGDVLFTYGVLTIASVSLKNAIVKSIILSILVMVSFVISYASIKRMKQSSKWEMWNYYFYFVNTSFLLKNRGKN